MSRAEPGTTGPGSDRQGGGRQDGDRLGDDRPGGTRLADAARPAPASPDAVSPGPVSPRPAPAAGSGRPATLRLEARLAPGADPRRRPPTPRRMVRRRMTLTAVKWLLPLGALLLLGAVALWPELNRALGAGRFAMRGLAAVELGTGRMVAPRYRGVDVRGRPYTVTADSAKEAGPERVDLVAPKGDVVMQNGAWLMLQSRDGVYMQHTGQLDLSGDVTLYRQDGTVMTSDTADVDLKQDSAASNDRTHAEGPFGTLDAQGFVLVDKGAVIQFQGPAHMVLNGGRP